VAQRILVLEGGGPESSARVAAGVTKACQKLAEVLVPIVGERGVRALLARSLALSTRSHPWLAGAGPPAQQPWLALQTCIEKQPPAPAIEAALCLLESFLDLLARFIGDGLVTRLLREPWPEVLSKEPT